MKFDFETVVDRSTAGSMKWKGAMRKLQRPLTIPPLSTADMEFVCCPSIEKSIIEALTNKGVMGYTLQPDGYNEAVIKWLKEEHGYQAKEEWILQTFGIVQALYTAIESFSEVGDGVLIQPPVYHQFQKTIENTKRVCIENNLIYKDGRYFMDFEDLEKKAKQAKIMILCSPHNPVGRVWDKEDLERVQKICNENNVIMIADEIHFDFIAKGYHHTCYGTLEESNMILCTSPSKTFNLAGLNISNIVIPNEELRNRFKQQLNCWGLHYQNYFGFYATMGAYSDEGKAWKNELNEVIADNFKTIKEFFNTNYPQMRVVELEATYLVWIDMSCLNMKGSDLEKMLMEKGEIFIEDGSKFDGNGEGFIRINIACPKSVLLEVLNRFKKTLG